MKTKILGVTASLLLLVACDPNHEMKEAIREKLKDPEAGKFGDIAYIADFETRTPSEYGFAPYACVEVNAKNAYGAYTGYKTWIVKKSKRYKDSYTASESDNYHKASTCAWCNEEDNDACVNR